MKNFIRNVATSLMLIASIPAIAADIDPFWGVRANFNMTTSTKSTDFTGWGAGGGLGISYLTPIGKVAIFQGAVSFNYNTINLDGYYNSKYNPAYYDGYFKSYSGRLPLSIGARLLTTDAVMLTVYTGPVLYFNFGSRAIYDRSTKTRDEHFDEKVTDSGMDIGWNFGIGADFFKHWHIHIEGTYSLSNMMMLSDMFGASTEAHLRRAEITVGVGYNF